MTMKIITRLDQWKEHGVISAEQHAFLTGLSSGEPFSLFLELNTLLYAGILTFVAGLGWTVSTWSQQLGDVLVVTALSAIFGASFWYCFSRAPAWSAAEVPSSGVVCDYLLYLGSLWNSLISKRGFICSPENGMSICLPPPSFTPSSLTVSTTASCCRSRSLRSPDGLGSPFRVGRHIKTRRTGNMPFFTACLSSSPEPYCSAAAGKRISSAPI